VFSIPEELGFNPFFQEDNVSLNELSMCLFPFPPECSLEAEAADLSGKAASSRLLSRQNICLNFLIKGQPGGCKVVKKIHMQP